MTSHNPFSAPQSPRGDRIAPGQPPGVIVWFKVYAALMALMYFFVAAAGAITLAAPSAASDPDLSPQEAIVYGVVFLILGLGLGTAYGYALFAPPRRWVWIYDLVLIGLGLTSCCCLPFSVPLLIFFLRTDTQNYFGA